MRYIRQVGPWLSYFLMMAKQIESELRHTSPIKGVPFALKKEGLIKSCRPTLGLTISLPVSLLSNFSSLTSCNTKARLLILAFFKTSRNWAWLLESQGVICYMMSQKVEDRTFLGLATLGTFWPILALLGALDTCWHFWALWAVLSTLDTFGHKSCQTSKNSI